mmetsp:Transcript_3127/g.6843  ORF Transcript_3127/g.6843 Transcript_3127/m.6843 type:complete len:396 (-) Transcript_3127:666-1853(-)
MHVGPPGHGLRGRRRIARANGIVHRLHAPDPLLLPGHLPPDGCGPGGAHLLAARPEHPRVPQALHPHAAPRQLHPGRPVPGLRGQVRGRRGARLEPRVPEHGQHRRAHGGRHHDPPRARARLVHELRPQPRHHGLHHGRRAHHRHGPAQGRHGLPDPQGPPPRGNPRLLRRARPDARHHLRHGRLRRRLPLRRPQAHAGPDPVVEGRRAAVGQAGRAAAVGLRPRRHVHGHIRKPQPLEQGRRDGGRRPARAAGHVGAAQRRGQHPEAHQRDHHHRHHRLPRVHRRRDQVRQHVQVPDRPHPGVLRPGPGQRLRGADHGLPRGGELQPQLDQRRLRRQDAHVQLRRGHGGDDLPPRPHALPLPHAQGHPRVHRHRRRALPRRVGRVRLPLPHQQV